jgi:hypothetical protein
MDDALLVGGFQRLSDLARDGQRFVERNWSLRDAIRDRRSFHQLHHQRHGPARSFQTVNVRDVRMIQSGEDFCFTLESGKPVRIGGDRRRQHLDRNLAFQVGIRRAKHFALPPAPSGAMISYGPRRVPAFNTTCVKVGRILAQAPRNPRP